MLKNLFLTGALGLGLAGPGHAVTVHTSAATFDADAGATMDVPLPDVGSVGTGPFAVGPLTFDSLSGTLFLGGIYGSTLIPGHDTAISGIESLRISMDTVTTAFGFFLHEPTTDTGLVDACNFTCVESTFEISAFLGGALVGSTIQSPDNDIAAFYGLVDLGGFDSVEIREISGTADNEFFGGFVVGIPAPVPLPASLPLIVGAMGMFGVMARRKKL